MPILLRYRLRVRWTTMLLAWVTQEGPEGPRSQDHVLGAFDVCIGLSLLTTGCDGMLSMNRETTRRRFMQFAAVGFIRPGAAMCTTRPHLGDDVEIKVDPVETLTKEPSVIWAIGLLRSSLESKGVSTQGGGKAVATIVIAPLGNA